MLPVRGGSGEIAAATRACDRKIDRRIDCAGANLKLRCRRSRCDWLLQLAVYETSCSSNGAISDDLVTAGGQNTASQVQRAANGRINAVERDAIYIVECKATECSGIGAADRLASRSIQ